MINFFQRSNQLQTVLFFLVIFVSLGQSYITNTDFLCNFEKPICRWRWNATLEHGFKVTSGEDAKAAFEASGDYAGPFFDSSNNTKGHYLHLKIVPGMKEVHVWSSRLSQTQKGCRIRVLLNMVNMTDGAFRVVVDSKTPWLVADVPGNDLSKWEKHEILIGRVQQQFRIVLEVSPSTTLPAYLSLDDIGLVRCFPEAPTEVVCTDKHFRCAADLSDYCLNQSQVCDIRRDCLNGADERQGCDAVPEIGRCDFEDGWCGWGNSEHSAINWTRQSGVGYVPRLTGPAYDHTYQNQSGMYLYANMSGTRSTLGWSAYLESVRINPPPRYHSRPNSTYYKSCNVRFFYHQNGRHSGSLALYLIELDPSGDRSMRLFYTFGEKGDLWMRQVVTIPTNITHSYYLQFEARKGLRSGGDVALDDVTMSPECFGLNVPEKEKEGYDYDSFRGYAAPKKPAEIHSAFVNKTVYLFTTCGAKGRTGPTHENCSKEYNNTGMEISVVQDGPLNGIQKWTVPERKFYTIIAKGAGGGTGSDGRGSSKGATAIGIMELTKADSLYILVGQEGNGGCRRNFAMTQHYTCGKMNLAKTELPLMQPQSPLRELKRLILKQNGGGGGGASFVYQWTKKDARIPLVIGAGGGGLGGGKSSDDKEQNGKGIDPTRLGVTGWEYGSNPPGAGGGWSVSNITSRVSTGRGRGVSNGTSRAVTGGALLQGALGGKACGVNYDFHGMGGFGGGGGGCNSGGGGGGYTGGSASADWKNGRGGYSYVALNMVGRRVIEGDNPGQGSVIIIPAVQGCGCTYLCAAVDEYREHVKCICPTGWTLGEDQVSCRVNEKNKIIISEHVIYGFLGIFTLTMICIMGYITLKCCTRKSKARARRREVEESELQLHRLRLASDSIMTEYNPNYEFGGGTYTIRDLAEVPREQLRLVRALGQGAFGEVYQGFYRHRPGEPEMAVAIKTLPELSSSQAESDFLMEALIMSKFNHANIVHFIGVCFDKHPRFIVLELLAGGDLKNFLRECRPKPGIPSPLTMKDLLLFALDVANGCAYLEEHRFIHRDIAARNCLLTSKGPGRQVKIADFGMARDIYRSDYYRKGGKAMLPIKWMPPEAFQDGIFTTKTDIWSFGILLWEVMSLGYMPYTGCGNREVMQLVVRGGRLEPPVNCPEQVYAIMTTCWHPRPDERPTFNLIIERIGYCLQDPDILSTQLPIFNRTPASERDTTIMRPDPDPEEAGPSEVEPDYLEPKPGSSKSVLGKNSDSLDSVFDSQQGPSTHVDIHQPGPSSRANKWICKGAAKNRRTLSGGALTLDARALTKQLPSSYGTRPIGPLQALRPLGPARSHAYNGSSSDSGDSVAETEFC